MENDKEEKKVTLKLLIDTKANKVLFAEVGKEFVDFLFHILSLPVGTIVDLLKVDSMVGCLGALYKSIQCLSGDYLQPNLNKDCVLKPGAPASVPLLTLTNTPTSPDPKTFYRCNNYNNSNSGSDFVDFIFTIMTLPLSTVTKLLNDEKVAGGMVGSLGSLYKSIESLGVQYYKPDINKNSVLKPRYPAAQGVPLLSLNDTTATTITYYACEKHHISTCMGNPGTHYCSACCGYRTYTTPCLLTYTPPKINPGYVKGEVPYIVMDNLEVKPMSISLIRSLFNDFDYQLDEQHVQFGPQQGIALLKASLEKQDVLTTVFLGKKK